MVFTWGIYNDGRLGITNEPGSGGKRGGAKDDEEQEQSHDLIPMKPIMVRFPDLSAIIVKVSCGNSFSIALT